MTISNLQGGALLLEQPPRYDGRLLSKCLSTEVSLQEDMLLTSKAVGQQLGELVIKQIAPKSMSLEVWNSLCLPRDQEDAPLLLVPEGYKLLDPEHSSKKMVELLQARKILIELHLCISLAILLCKLSLLQQEGMKAAMTLMNTFRGTNLLLQSYKLGAGYV